MSNGRHLRRRSRHNAPITTIEAYVDALTATGMDEREIARAYFYADHFGLEAMNRGDGCLVFAEPACADWNCLNPEHQVFES